MRNILVSLAVAASTLAGAHAEEMLTPSNVELLKGFAPYDGKAIAVEPCMMTVMEINGQYACRLVDEAGKDMKTADNLPVDIFVTVSGLDETSRSLLAAHCDKYGLCEAMRIAGTLKVRAPLQIPEFQSATLSLAGR